jgi:HAE1 family hydrophobic/amphiphilic exporter-1
MKLSEQAINKPITTIMITLSVLVLGAISVTRLPLAWAPDLTWPSMIIYVQYPSSSPEESEREITKPLEEVMGTLAHVKALSSQSSGSRCRLRLQFAYDTDMDLMAVHIRDRLDKVRELLPDDVERIEIRRWNTEDWPVLTYTMSWQGEDPMELSHIYKHTIQPRLQRVPGVGNVDTHGLEEKVLLVEADQNLLNAHSVDIRSLHWAIRSNNVNVSAGHVNDSDRRLSVRSVGEFENVSEIRELPIRNGFVLGDVADVSYDYPDQKSFQHLDGRAAVNLDVRKASTANLVSTANLIKKEMEAILDDVGRDKLTVKTIRDRSKDVVTGISTLVQSAAIGGALAILVIFIFLRNFRSTLIIGSAIPISALTVFVIMYGLREIFGSSITLNLVSMMGLMVAIGMLVDPAVVCLENIYRKRFDEGMSAFDAALEGSREVGMPVLTAALTTVCVFIPIIFVTDSGYALWMKDFAVTVCISVIASLCVALTLVPLAVSRAFQPGADRFDIWLKAGFSSLILACIVYLIHQAGLEGTGQWAMETANWLVAGFDKIPTIALAILSVIILGTIILYLRFRKVGIKPLYAGLINATLRYRWSTVAVACLVLSGGYYLYTQVGKRPFRWQPARQVAFNVEVPKSYSLESAVDLYAEVEKVLMASKDELNIDAVSTRFSTTGSKKIVLYLVPAEEGELSVDQVKKKVKALLPNDIPGVRFKSGRSWGSSSTGVSVELKGRDPDVMAILAEDVKMRMVDIEGVHEVETSLESGLEEIQVTVNRRRAQRYGLSPRQIATTISTALGSRGNSKFKTDDGEIDIQLRLKEEDRATLEQLKNTVFESDTGGLVSFASLANFNLKQGPRAIEHEDRMTTVKIFANTERSSIMPVGTEMRKRMVNQPLPSGYSWQMDRSFRRMSKEQKDDDFTMVFAAVLIYMIMAALFESYIHPFTIMFSITFAFTGVAIGLYTFNVNLDNNTSYGLLILFGIVVNNGIVLVDHINRYRQQGLHRREAIVRGGQDRLRPILMTAITTVLGLAPLVVPMIYGTAEGTARLWGPMGLVVISGLMASTILTLILLPTVYSLMDDLGQYIKRLSASVQTS